MSRRSLAAVSASTVIVAICLPATIGRATEHPANPSPPAAVLRVDQIGYPTNSPKVADLMTTHAMTGDAYRVETTAGHSVLTGTVGASAGAWSSTYPYVYRLRFTAVTATGTYRIDLTGPSSSVRSPTFQVAPAGELYGEALRNALSFYENERDGPDYIPSALRTAPGDLSDEHAMTYSTPKMNGNGNFKGSLARLALGTEINASGGWFDAGDYLKFVETTSYVVDMMLQGVESFGDAMGAGKGAAVNFTAEARHGLLFLSQMWNEKTRTLYYQVGVGEANNYYYGDHDIWRLPQADDTYMGTNPRYVYIRHPPVLRAGPPGSAISPNLAGRLAAAFALGYRVYRTSNPAEAKSWLHDAETIYALAGTHWHGNDLLTAAPYDFYPETSWQDDMELGATELSLATNDASRHGGGAPSAEQAARYLILGSYWARRYATGPEAGSDTLNLYDVSSLADYELARAMRLEPATPGVQVTRSQLVDSLAEEIGLGLSVAKTDPFGFGFAWDQWDTTTHGLGLSIMANEYDSLTGTSTYAAQAQGWLDNVLGNNAWGVSLIVGDGTTFPDCMQHQIANIVGSLDGKPPILAGAVVEGPNSFAARGTVPNMKPCPPGGGNAYAAFGGHNAVFADNVQSYSTVEPAIDLTSLSPLAFAWQESAADRSTPAA